MKVFFTKKAQADYFGIKSFVLTKWGDRVAEAFEQKVSDFLDILERFPELGQVEVLEKEIRGFQLTKQTRIFYRIKEERVIILAFFDVRKNPNKRPN